MDLEPERLLPTLRKLRIGHVAIPQDHVRTRRPNNDATPCLKATVPDSLIRALDRGQEAPRVRLEVFSVADEYELWATLAMKRANAELRILMPLDDAGVQALFRHGLRGGDLSLALETEDDELSADVIVGVNLGSDREFEGFLRKARCLDGSLTRLAQVAQLMSCAVSMPSVQVDICVSEVVVVLASNRAHAMVATPSSPPEVPPAM